jgi:hypothetical protein
METTATISINEVGEVTGLPFSGKFLIKTVLSRRDNFLADERRRFMLGSNPNGALPNLQGEALILGILSVRIIESPKWWSDSDNGLELADDNIIGTLFKLSEEKAAEHKKELQDQAKNALEKLGKSAKKVVSE